MNKMTFDDFLKGIDPFTESFVVPLHRTLGEKGYKVEVKPAAQGPVVSYLIPKQNRTVFNYVFRKNGMYVRIYGDNAYKYQDFLQTLSDSMIKSIEKAAACRQCNARCPKGYFTLINGVDYNKCRYGAFLFPLNLETAPFIKTFIENETLERENTIEI